MMKTPICDFVKKYSGSNSLRMHMPGHKGKGFLGFEELDITEIDGADVLYHSCGIIKESQDNAAALFCSEKTLYSAEGSSLSLRAMLYLAVLHARSLGKKPLIAAGRNAHKVFISAAALLDFNVDWLRGDGNLVSCNLTAELLDLYFLNAEEKATAVFVTSPDYLGNMLDIAALSKVCHAHGALLLVDNAHGAYLNFLPASRHPLSLGADMCCDSAHKTLPVLTGGAYLHIAKGAPKLLAENAESAMALFASTSPSYLILQSLDAANKYIADCYPQKLAEFAEKIGDMKENLAAAGYTLCGSEPLKVTIAAKSYGYTGEALAQKLSDSGIVCEFYDRDYLTLMLSPEMTDVELARLKHALLSGEKSVAITEPPPSIPMLERVISIREATMSLSCEVEIKEAVGEVLADASVSCPPAIPIAICGEMITEAAVKCFEYYGIKKCRIIGKK